MNLTQLTTTLRSVFEVERERIVFWNDPEKEFADVVSELDLPGINIVRLDETGALAMKMRLEREDPNGQYLLYAPTGEPDFDDDWLLDIRLYSRSFRADRASIILDELGLAHQAMRQHINKRRKFFDNKERVRKLKQFVTAGDDEQALDRKMLAVTARADQPELFSILHTLFHALAESEQPDLDEPPPAWQQIEKFDLDEPFWALAEATFGYSEENPSLRNLLIQLFVTDFAQSLGSEVPTALQTQLLPRAGSANAIVCMARWRDSASKAASYNRLASAVASRVHLDTYLPRFEIEDLIEVQTFFEIEKAIVSGLLERVNVSPESVDSESVRGVAGRRQTSHWVQSHSVPDAVRKARLSVYEALAVGAELMALRGEYTDGFDHDSAAAMYAAYQDGLYEFDQRYRHFCENADRAEARGWDLLKPLRERIEALYSNWYLTQLGLAWGRYVDRDLLSEWRIHGVDNQYEFFARRVQPRLEEAENRRVFVIISDALRYEVAQELTRELNGKYRFEAELTSQLGVLPSYTALGMASLLPHESLRYKANGAVLVDDRPTASLDQRNEILSRWGGMAIRAGDLTSLPKEAGRQLVEDSRLVYIYHNEIDARGDSAATESGTFDACRKAINELADTVRYVINNLNGNYLLVTADHGFLFTETAPDDADKSKLIDKPAGTVKAKKRYLLGHALGNHDDVWHGRTKITAEADGDMEFWVPKGSNRFHFVGGARFLHGGAMLQEIVVPVIRVKHARSAKGREKTRTRQATVQVLGTNHKITTPKHRFKLVQMEPVSERVKPSRLKVAVYDGDEAVTNIETVNFDSTSGNLDERQKDVILTLQDRTYDKRTNYRLVLRDADTNIEQQSLSVIIDRAFADDFDF